MNKTTSIIVLIIVVLLIGWFAFTHRSSTISETATSTDTTDVVATTTDTPNATSTATSTPQATTTTSSAPSTKTFTVTGQNFSFAPSTLTVNKGEKVAITFKNASGFHDFRIDEFNVATKQISGGQSETVTFTADKTGSFEYYCSVGNHRAMGMHGTLIVK